jgi:oligopeptide transport system permease protein
LPSPFLSGWGRDYCLALPGKLPDYLTMFFSTIGISVPSFILGTLLMYFLSFRWGLLPSAMWGTPKHMIMPAIALAGLPTAFIARLTRSSMLDVLNQDYMRTALAKGCPAGGLSGFTPLKTL